MKMPLRVFLVALAACVLALFTSCSNKSTSAKPSGSGEPKADAITVESSAFKAGAAIPAKFGGEGEDVSPALAWKGAPPEAKELALVVDDPDAPGGEAFVHWMAWGLAPDRTELPEGASKSDKTLKQGKNDFDEVGYKGPMPPKGGGVHHYHFNVYALKSALALSPDAKKEEILAAIKDRALARGELIGVYERK